ncbi:MAG: hypothetical protein KOO60_02350 [Gemmatimonadales bacterium]|nr:hypothetical protein [Gemmatimonadales bacterium]
MKEFSIAIVLTVIFSAFAVIAIVSAEPLPNLINVDQLTGPSLDKFSAPAKAATDSLYLLGGPGVLSGKFQNEDGLPDRQGWTGIDLNQETEFHWQVSTFNAGDLDPGTADNRAWWCGSYFESCNAEDPAEGYGDYWRQYLDWYGTVPDPLSNVTVRIQAVISYDIEPGEDYLFLQVDDSEWMENLDSFTYQGTAEIVNLTATLTPDYFVGELGDQVHLRWAVLSDGAWSDEDCRWPSAGAAQIDLIQVHFDQGLGEIQMGHTETLEPGVPLQWEPSVPQGPGDFSQVLSLLGDADPTAGNNTPQFVFIDDGVVVPGTGGYPCTTHCYGPGGYIVNPEGGLAGQFECVASEIWSPVLTVPVGGWDSALFSFDHYVHAELNNGGPFVLGLWHVRSTDDPAGQTGWSEWRDRNFALWGDPRYVRESQNVTDLLVPGFTHVQLALGVRDYYSIGATDGTPAPYFDNVSLKVYKNVEPSALLVRSDGSGDFPTIQAAINAVASQDTVLLADGVFTGDGNRDLYFMGKDIVICSQSGKPEDCIIDLEGAPGDLHRGFLFTYEEGPGSVISSVTITGGFQDIGSTSFTSNNYSGGAIACRPGSSPTINNCIFSANSAVGNYQQGGAIFCDDASPLISDCIFSGNTAWGGGAIGATGISSPVINNCLFVGNEALTFAGAVFAYYADVHFTVSSSTFYGNINPAASATLVSYRNGRFDIDHTIIAFGSSGYAAAASDTTDFQFTCSNIYGNTIGDWYGYFANQLGDFGNISYDPLFCLEKNPALPYGIDENSPCRSTFNPTCGLVGYYPIGCGDWSAAENHPATHERARLLPSYPNPFNPQTTVSFNLPSTALVGLRVFSLDGRLVATLINETMSAGPHEIKWNGRDDQGRAVASGVFFCRLKAGPDADSIRIVLLK